MNGTTNGIASPKKEIMPAANNNTPNNQNKKRTAAGGGAADEPSSKKAHIAPPPPAEFNPNNADEAVQVKVMIPTSAVGAIIGKGGEAMRSLKNESGCRVQMSKSQEVYPGTNERICLVKGKLSSVMQVLETIMEKVREKMDKNVPPDQFDLKNTDRNKEMKFIVPNTSAGMVIGKSGSRIKEIRDATGANIQVYPKQGSQEARVSQERIITVGGESQSVLVAAVQRVLEKIAADPMHAANSDIGVIHPGIGVGGGGGGPMPGGPGGPMPGLMDEYGHGGGGGGYGGQPPQGPHQYGQGGPDQMFGRPPPNQGPPPFSGPPPNQSSYGGPPPGGYGGPPPQQQQQQQPPPMQQQQQQPQQMFQQPPPAVQQQQPVQQQQQAPRPLMDNSFGASPAKDSFNGTPTSGGTSKLNLMQGLGNSEILAFLDSLQSTLRTSGFNDQAVAEIMQAMQVLAKYNIMGLGLGLGVAAMAQMRSAGGGGQVQQQQQQQQPQQQQQMQSQQQMSMGGGSSSTPGAGGRSFESDYRPSTGGVLIDVMSQSSQQHQQQKGPGFAQPVVKDRPQMDPGYLEIEVSESVIGAVLGQKLKTLQDIQMFSGAKVDANKRGNAPPGIRLITISGEPDNVRAGRVMIEQVINEEQQRRMQPQQRAYN